MRSRDFKHWSDVVGAMADADRRCPQKMDDTELTRIRALTRLGRTSEARAVAEHALRLHVSPELDAGIRRLLTRIITKGRFNGGHWEIRPSARFVGGVIDPAGHHVVLRTDDAVELEKLPTRFVVWRTVMKGEWASFDASGRELFVTGRQHPRRVAVLDAATGKRLRTLTLPEPPEQIESSKSVMAVVVGEPSSNSRVLLVDPRTGSRKALLPGARGPIALSHDGALVATAEYSVRGPSVGLWRPSDATLVRHVDVPDPPARIERVGALRFSPHDKWLAVGYYVTRPGASPRARSGIARVMKVAQGPLEMLGPNSGPIDRFRFDTAHDSVLVIPAWGGWLVRYDLHTHKRLGPKRTYSPDYVVDRCSLGILDCRVASAVSADGLVLAFARKSVTRLLVRSPRVEVRKLEPCGTDAVTHVALDAKGRLLAAACANGTAVVVATDSGAPRLRVAAAAHPIRQLAMGGAGLVIARDFRIEVHTLSGGVTRWPTQGAEALAAAPASREVAWGTPHGVFVLRGGAVQRVASSRHGVSAIAVSSSAVAWGEHGGSLLECKLPCHKPAIVGHPVSRAPAEASAICLDPAGKVVVHSMEKLDPKATRFAFVGVTPTAMACPSTGTVAVDGSGHASLESPRDFRITVDVESGAIAALNGDGYAVALNGGAQHLYCIGGEATPIPRECCPPLFSPHLLAPGARWPYWTVQDF